MAFESLAHRYTFSVPNFPQRWLPLIHLYDPDLPLFPIYYFHVLSNSLSQGSRPRVSDRAYGFVEKVNLRDAANTEITIVTNKDLNDPQNAPFVNPVRDAVYERFGLLDPVRKVDVQNVFMPPLDHANAILPELWERVVANAYDNMLPFGKLWDEVLGLTRWVASWNSPNGRKGELIQTHYFASKFGERIQSTGSIPDVDFYLLPTIQEVTDIHNPLTIFPKYSQLVEIANLFQTSHCSVVTVGGTGTTGTTGSSVTGAVTLSKFRKPSGRGRFNTAGILGILNGTTIPHRFRSLAIEVFNTFDKGPQRTVIFLMMLDDIRKGRLSSSTLTSSQLGSIYDGMKTTYQSPKVIAIYAQQSFGNVSAIPIDTWIKTFFKWPLKIHPTAPRARNVYTNIFSKSRNLGKVERLLWVAGQARKVHSSVCNDALWCLKYSSNQEPRGANPLACNICLDSIRNVCPAYEAIRGEMVCFDTAPTAGERFRIDTNGNKFVKCTGTSIYGDLEDDFSPADDPNGFAPYPDASHPRTPITVDQFVRTY